MRSVLMAITLFLLFTVSTAAADTELSLVEQFEVSLGQSAAERILDHYGEYKLPLERRVWLQEIFRRLVQVVERSHLPYILRVLDTSKVNAMALPGGNVFITRGMLQLLRDDEHAVANVLGHEIAHVEKRHGFHSVLRQMGLSVLLEVGLTMLDVSTSETMRVATNLLLHGMESGWGREAEYEADMFGQIYAANAGFDPGASLYVLHRIHEMEEGPRPLAVFRTHPEMEERIGRTLLHIAQFWEGPQAVDVDWDVITEIRRVESEDAYGRFQFSHVEGGGEMRLTGWDLQTDKPVEWLHGVEALHHAWNPDSSLLAVSVRVHNQWQLRIQTRLGYVLQHWIAESDGDYLHPSWSPDGRMVAFQKNHGETSQIVVGYLAGAGNIVISGSLENARQPAWGREGLFFLAGDGAEENQRVYVVHPPEVRPVVLEYPVPRVLQRHPRLAPELIREDDRLILRRPEFGL